MHQHQNLNPNLNPNLNQQQQQQHEHQFRVNQQVQQNQADMIAYKQQSAVSLAATSQPPAQRLVAANQAGGYQPVSQPLAQVPLVQVPPQPPHQQHQHQHHHQHQQQQMQILQHHQPPPQHPMQYEHQQAAQQPVRQQQGFHQNQSQRPVAGDASQGRYANQLQYSKLEGQQAAIPAYHVQQQQHQQLQNPNERHLAQPRYQQQPAPVQAGRLGGFQAYESPPPPVQQMAQRPPTGQHQQHHQQPQQQPQQHQLQPVRAAPVGRGANNMLGQQQYQPQMRPQDDHNQNHQMYAQQQPPGYHNQTADYQPQARGYQDEHLEAPEWCEPVRHYSPAVESPTLLQQHLNGPNGRRQVNQPHLAHPPHAQPMQPQQQHPQHPQHPQEHHQRRPQASQQHQSQATLVSSHQQVAPMHQAVHQAAPSQSYAASQSPKGQQGYYAPRAGTSGRAVAPAGAQQAQTLHQTQVQQPLVGNPTPPLTPISSHQHQHPHQQHPQYQQRVGQQQQQAWQPEPSMAYASGGGAPKRHSPAPGQHQAQQQQQHQAQQQQQHQAQQQQQHQAQQQHKQHLLQQQRQQLAAGGHCEPPRPTPKSYAPGQAQYQAQQPAPAQVGAQQQQQPQQLLQATSQASGAYQAEPALVGSPQPARITLPYSGAPLLGPLRLEHDVQYASKVFHLSQHLFDTLAKSSSLRFQSPAPSVVHELQLKAYQLVGSQQQQVAPSASCKHQQQHFGPGDSLLAAANRPPLVARQCLWPDSLQVSVNQQPVYLADQRNCKSGSAPSAVSGTNIFALCQPGENVIEFSGVDCYCLHEFTLETIERPLLAAFVSTCLRKRLLDTELSVAKLRNLICHEQAQRQQTPTPTPTKPTSSVSECLAIYNQDQQASQQEILFRLKTSLKCPISGCRMATPARGANCKHLQCFDLEAFLLTNKHRSQWQCPVCSAPVHFNAIDVDQLLLSILSEMADILDTDEILFNELGHYQAYYADSVALASPPATAPAYHQTPPPPPPPKHQFGSGYPALEAGRLASPMGQPVRRPASSLAGSPAAATSLQPQAKKTYSGQFNNNTAAGQQQFEVAQASKLADELSPLAAMERTIIQHEQQMLLPAGFEANQTRPANKQPSPRHSPARQQQQVGNFAAASPQNGPSASPLVAAGGGGQSWPDLPPTPSNNSQASGQPSQQVAPAAAAAATPVVVSQHDQQPLSNGSASVGSIMSSSTMTPGSHQSLGSVGMGGDSRCATAPPPPATGSGSGSGSNQSAASQTVGQDETSRHLLLKDSQGQAKHQGSSLLLGSGSSAHHHHHHHQHHQQHQQQHQHQYQHQSQHQQQGQLVDSSELAMALNQVADWKSEQQNDESRGKSQHLANFLNEPLLSTKANTNLNCDDTNGANGHQIDNRATSLNGNQQQQIPQHDLVCSYLDTVNDIDDTGLPPDDSILDLFER